MSKLAWSSTLFATALLISRIRAVAALDNGVGIAPAMGWNTWNSYGMDISEDTIVEAAQAMKDLGLDRHGYHYVNIDDGWQAPERASDGSPVADPDKFPSGIKGLAEKVNKLGFKLGIYSDGGTYTCGRRYGSLGYEEVDAKAYADWGVEHLKYDNCYNEGQSGTPNISATRYRAMGNALNATGKHILYSLCSWGDDEVWNWGSTVANSWRMSGDIYDNFDRYDDRCPCQTSIEPCPLRGFRCSVMNIIEKAAGLGQKAQAGAYNDLDMLEVGNGGMTYDEYVAHFSVWALAKSPLILGNRLKEMTNETLSIITNPHIIALNQDENHSAGYRISKAIDSEGGSVQVWKTDLVNGTYGLLVLNATPHTKTVNASMYDFFIDEGKATARKTWDAFDLWRDASLTTTIRNAEPLSVEVRSHAVRVFKLVEAPSSRSLHFEL